MSQCYNTKQTKIEQPFFLYRLKNYTGHVCKSPHYIIPTKGIKKNLWTALLTNNPFTAGQHVVTQIVLPTWTKQENSPIFLNDAYWHSECSRLSSKCTLGVGDIQNVADSHQNAHSKSLRSESQRQNSSSFHQHVVVVVVVVRVVVVDN